MNQPTYLQNVSFVEGMARILDSAGTLCKPWPCETTENPDRLALYEDWCMIGRDITQAMWQYELVTTSELSGAATNE